MKVFVFGATGFLGRALVHKLVMCGVSVSVLTRDYGRAKAIFEQGVIIHVGDMITDIYPELSVYDAVINCAGEVKDEALMRQLHVDGVRTALLSLAMGSGTQWIQISSVGVYGPHTFGVVSEEFSFNPIGEYEATKADGEIVVKDICVARGIPYTIIRPSNVFGNNMPNSSLAQLVRMIKRKMFFFIGNPDYSMMNYVYVQDVADAIFMCIGNSEAVNNDFIVSDVIDLRTFVRLVKTEVGGGWSPVVPESIVRLMIAFLRVIPGFPLSIGRLDALLNKTVYSTNKINACLGFTPRVGNHVGLRKYCKYLMG